MRTSIYKYNCVLVVRFISDGDVGRRQYHYFYKGDVEPVVGNYGVVRGAGGVMCLVKITNILKKSTCATKHIIQLIDETAHNRREALEDELKSIRTECAQLQKDLDVKLGLLLIADKSPRAAELLRRYEAVEQALENEY